MLLAAAAIGSTKDVIWLLNGGVNVDATNKVRYRPSPHLCTYEGTIHVLSEYNV